MYRLGRNMYTSRRFFERLHLEITLLRCAQSFRVILLFIISQNGGTETTAGTTEKWVFLVKDEINNTMAFFFFNNNISALITCMQMRNYSRRRVT